MAKWSYLRRAYAIKEYAEMRETESENSEIENGCTAAEADSLAEVIYDIRYILDMASGWVNTSDSSDSEYRHWYRTKKQCEKFLADFA